MTFVCVKEQQLAGSTVSCGDFELSHTAVTVTWQLELPRSSQTFPFKVWDLHFPLPPIATGMESLQRGRP